MTAPDRTPVGSAYREQVSLLGALEASSESARLEAALTGDGGGRGGERLGELLAGLGEAYVVDGRVRWERPADLAPEYADYLARSVDELNRLLDAGTFELDQDANIRPAGRRSDRPEAGRTSGRASRWHR